MKAEEESQGSEGITMMKKSMKKKSKPQNKKKYAGGGAIGSPGSPSGGAPFFVGGDFLRQLLQSSGIDPQLLNRLQRQGLGNRGPAGRFDHPTVIPAAKVPQAKTATKAGKHGGMVSRGYGIARSPKGKKSYS